MKMKNSKKRGHKLVSITIVTFVIAGVIGLLVATNTIKTDQIIPVKETSVETSVEVTTEVYEVTTEKEVKTESNEGSYDEIVIQIPDNLIVEEEVAVRTDPSDQDSSGVKYNNVKYTLHYGDKITVIDRIGDRSDIKNRYMWKYISTEKGEGWIPASAISQFNEDLKGAAKYVE